MRLGPTVDLVGRRDPWCSDCGTAHPSPPPFACDPVVRHFGMVDGVPACGCSPCEHGWPAAPMAPTLLEGV